MPYIIVGNSAAGLAAAESIRKTDSQTEIVIISDEQYTAYSRVLTTNYIAGQIPLEKIFLYDQQSYEALGAKVVLGRSVVLVRPAEKMIVLDDGRELYYTKLLIATGASAVLPTMPGISARGVYTLRTLDDAVAIKEQAQRATDAVVVGGGFVGVKVALALQDVGLRVRLIVSSQQLLSQMLEKKAADLVEKKLRARGIAIYYGQDVHSILDKLGEVRGVLTSDGHEHKCQLIVFGKGIEPNTELLRGSGVRVDRGVVVNQFLETSVPDVYAAGDVVQAYDCIRGEPAINAVWTNAVEQGKVAGANMAGLHWHYGGATRVNAIEVDGLAVISMGLPRARGEGVEVVERSDDRGYRRLVMKEGRIIGATLVNDLRAAGLVYYWIKDGLPKSRKQPSVFTGFAGVLLNSI